MSEQEIFSTDLYTIYKLIDVHAKFNDPKAEKRSTKNKNEESEVYIDSIIF